jgi:2'-hydroxyisoflavone reductase
MVSSSNHVLILGGTRFVGRHIVDALLQRGHDVVLFNRGKSNRSAFADLEQIHGDRTTDLPKLGERTWDAVVDTSGYFPRDVETSARYFSDRASYYLFVSSISAYDFAAASPDAVDEDAPLAKMPEGADATEVTPETYGALKALCEAIVRDAFGERAAIVRPGVVAGPHDPTDRFTYWPVRIDAGGTALAPDGPEHPIQYIDARDLAQFAAALIENRRSGTYNAVTQHSSRTFGELIEACRRASASPAGVRWIDEATLQNAGVEPWTELPLWIPRDTEDFTHLRVSNERAAACGLQTRPIAETVRDTLAWARAAHKRLDDLENGLSPSRERDLFRSHIS